MPRTKFFLSSKGAYGADLGGALGDGNHQRIHDDNDRDYRDHRNDDIEDVANTKGQFSDEASPPAPIFHH